MIGTIKTLNNDNVSIYYLGTELKAPNAWLSRAPTARRGSEATELEPFVRRACNSAVNLWH